MSLRWVELKIKPARRRVEHLVEVSLWGRGATKGS